MSDFDDLDGKVKGGGSTSAPISEAAAELEAELESEKDARKEDRFLFVLISVIAVDVHIFKNLGGWAGILCVGVFEALLLLILARRLGVDDVEVWFSKALSALNIRNNANQ